MKNSRPHPRLDFQAAVQNVAYATTAEGGLNTQDGIGTRSGSRTEESDYARESYGTKTGVGATIQRNCIRCLSLKNFQPWKFRKLARFCIAWVSSII